MCVVAAGLSFEIHGRIPTTTLVRVVAAAPVLGLEALLARPRLQEGTIDREMLVRQQPGRPRLLDHRLEEMARDLVFQQAIMVLAEGRRVPHRLIHAQADEPAEQQVVADLLDQQTGRLATMLRTPVAKSQQANPSTSSRGRARRMKEKGTRMGKMSWGTSSRVGGCRMWPG